MPLDLSKGQQDILAADGHLLVTGGPGSGKTTIAILKAAKIIGEQLNLEQRVLFLSFARATVARVIEAIREEPEVSPAQRRQIEVQTYHSFFWQIITSHGYLIGLPRKLSLLAPAAEAIALSAIRSDYAGKLSAQQQVEKCEREEAERWRLAREEGKVCFDLFAPCVIGLLSGSERLRRLVSLRYPIIVLDEFQDTNAGQWEVVQALGQFSTLVALADPDQRIFDFIGADPARLDHFRETFHPTDIDLSSDNHRSKGTEIALFGNEILTGQFTKGAYAGVEFETFAANQNQAHMKLRLKIMEARGRLIAAGGSGWSVVVLVPTKRMTRDVSDLLKVQLGNLPPIRHSASVDMEGAVLAAEVVAYLMQPAPGLSQLIELVQGYFRGKNGDGPTRSALEEASRIGKAHQRYLELAPGKALAGTSVLVPILATFEAVKALPMTGDPDADWQAVRNVLEASACPRLQEIGNEVRNVRLLDKGTVLRQGLSLDWRTYRDYRNALAIVRQAFVEEHFANSARPETGVIVMNMHKAKGKQFDEVIIFEGWPIKVHGKIVTNPHRIVRSNERTDDLSQARQNLRVSVTRARQRTTILTPQDDPCVLLVPD